MTVAKTIEISAQSTKGFDAAIQEGIESANKTIDNLESVWVKDQKVLIGNDGKPESYRVHMMATFKLN